MFWQLQDMFFLNEIITDENLVSEGLGVLLQEIQFISNRILKFGSQRLHTARTKSQHSRNTIWNNIKYYYYDSMILIFFFFFFSTSWILVKENFNFALHSLIQYLLYHIKNVVCCAHYWAWTRRPWLKAIAVFFLLQYQLMIIFY